MRNIDRKDLPVYYYWNSSAWMQAGIFSHWLTKLILLLLDNATVHSLEDVSFSNIKLHYLPKNTTAHSQPCDAGIILLFKVSIVLCWSRTGILPPKPANELDDFLNFPENDNDHENEV
jgi:hypothetical protein